MPAAGCSQRTAARPGCRRPQAEQVADRRWQAGHHGWPVAREMPHGALRPHIEHVRTARVTQREHCGPSAVLRSTGLRRPQPMQVSRFAGSAMKQFAHSGWPWPSRVTGSRRAPQRAHCSILECAMHVLHTRMPPSGLSIRTTRRQPGQAGRTIPATPAASSKSISHARRQCAHRHFPALYALSVPCRYWRPAALASVNPKVPGSATTRSGTGAAVRRAKARHQ
jgi:hypothetical protein